MKNFLKLDSISHLSYDKKQGLLIGKGLTKGSEFDIKIETESGGIEHIKAGKIPVIIFGDVKTKVKGNQKHRINRAGYDLARLQKRVTALHSKICNDKSRSIQGKPQQ